ncbi:MAG: excinuclease ABC subunit UvrB [Deltaproteobacteria bacterium]|nr:excinuclease ABC subunit UvrB [Deltaproteobacteria bacterium]
MSGFKLTTQFTPAGDQRTAIDELVSGVNRGDKHQVLLGVTGSGKTFTAANVIAQTGRSALVLAPNKTLAAQLYGEFKELFPENAVGYFVSYYDYYQPEAYLPSSDTFIEKDSSINEEIDKLRHEATYSLLERNDVIIVSSVSCIYGLGSPEAYHGMLLRVSEGDEISRDAILRKLVEIQYERKDSDFHRGTFRVRGDIIEIFPVYEEDRAVRIELFGDYVDSLSLVDPLRGVLLEKLEKVVVYPGSHYVIPPETLKRALKDIRLEMEERIRYFKSQEMHLEAQRIEQRTSYDLEMIEEIGHCQGIENYSRHLTGRKEGEPPPTLLDFFPDDFLIVIDESHVSIPQLRGMYKGDRSRKETLVNFGFRLPSALDNRPLCFEEFEKMLKQAIYVSATPADYELNASGGVVVEQLVRPTGLVDPIVHLRPAGNQVDDLLNEIRKCVKGGNKILVTTLTKRMAEDLTEYYDEMGVRVRYMHSDVETLERIELIRSLRAGEYDVLVGINLLREGLDIPEVSLVAILDADKEGFLRSETSLVQTCGRAARNVNGQVIMYADRKTGSMERAISEMERRRKLQTRFNEEQGITPTTVKKNIKNIIESIYESDYVTVPKAEEEKGEYIPLDEIPEIIKSLKKEMKEAAADLAFEKAAQIRDRIKALEFMELEEL